MYDYVDYFADFSDIYEKSISAYRNVNERTVSSNVCSQLASMINVLSESNNKSVTRADDTVSSYRNVVSSALKSVENINNFYTLSYTFAEKTYINLRKALDLLKVDTDTLKDLCDNKPVESSYESSEGYNTYEVQLRVWQEKVTSLKTDCQSLVDASNQFLQYLDTVNAFNPSDDLTAEVLTSPSFNFDSLGYQKMQYLAGYDDKGNPLYFYGYDNAGNPIYLDDFGSFVFLTSNNVGTVCLDQGMFDVMNDPNSPEYQRLLAKFEARGMTEQDVIRFFNNINSPGCCSYCQFMGTILHEYKDDPDYFASKFGFPLYTEVDGKQVFNGAELLADLYFYVNDSANGSGKLWDTTNGFTYKSGNPEQRYVSFTDDENFNLLNGYLQSHGIDKKYYSNLIYERNNGKVSVGEDVSSVRRQIMSAIDNPDYSVSINYGPHWKFSLMSLGWGYSGEVVPMYHTDTQGYIFNDQSPICIGGGHAVNAVAYSNNGVIINTWGNLYTLKWEDLLDANCGYTEIGIVNFDD